MIIWDIETGPIDDERLRALLPPFNPPPHPGEFDPSSVKCGNIGGQNSEKGKAKVAEARKAHETTVANFTATVATAERDHWQKFVESAPLDATRGQVLAIGLHDCDRDKTVVLHGKSEGELIIDFWRVYTAKRQAGVKLVGHYIFDFDLPFMVRRSWLNCIGVPATVFDGRFFDGMTFVDTCRHWKLGTRGNDKNDNGSGLDALAQAFGIEGKPDESHVVTVAGHRELPLCGANFHWYYRDGGENRERAIDYLMGDLRMTAEIAGRMGIV